VTCGAFLKVRNHSSNSGVSAWSLNCFEGDDVGAMATSWLKIFTDLAPLLMVAPRVPGA